MISQKQYVSIILECENAFICAIWTHKTKRKTGNMVYKYFSVISYHSREAVANFNIFLRFQYCLDKNHIIVQGFLLIMNWPFKKVKILCEAMIGLEKSFWMIYSNTHLRTRETLPLKGLQHKISELCFFLHANSALQRNLTMFLYEKIKLFVWSFRCFFDVFCFLAEL